MKKKIIRLISALLLLSMCMGLFSGCISEDVSQDNPSGKTELDAATTPEGNTVLNEFTDRTIHNEEDALAAIQEVSTVTGITNVSSTLGGVQQFTSLDSTFYRFAQVYEGIPVYGRSVTVGASSEGNGQGLSHNYIQISDVDTTPAISKDTAKQSVVEMYGADIQVTSCSLTIYSLFGYTPILAWQVQVAGPAMLYTCFVDAHTGAFINCFPGIFTDSELGTYTDSNGTIDFYTVQNPDGTYSLIDEARNLEVYDANYQTVIKTIVDDQGNVYQYDSEAEKWLDGSGREVDISGSEDENSFWLMHGSWDVLDAQGNVVGRNADYLPCAGNPLNALHILSNPTTAWSNQKAAAAMSLTEDIYDFYHSVLGRTGFNGNNGTVRICVNDDINGDPSNAYSSLGDSRAFTFLSFGHAGTITADLIGHEFNHSVEQSISSLVYQGESGAIMEALADVFGELSEDWIADHQLDDDCDWIHGSRNMIDPAISTQQACFYEYNGQTCPVKENDKEGKHRIGEGLKKPSWFSTGSCVLDIPYPKFYQGENYYLGSGDNGGVHTNHTVVSHAAYLMTHPAEPTAEALTNEELAKVLYHAISYLPSDCNFESFASYICLSAEVLKISEAKQDCIVQAFKSVGIDANNVLLVTISENPLDYMVTETSMWKVFGRSSALCDDYALCVSGKEPLQNLYHTGPFEGADQATTEYKVTTKDPLTLTLDPGYMYNFEFVDGTDPENVYLCKVGVYEDSLGLIDIIDLHTKFGPSLAVKDNGLVFLTERPSADRPGLFTFKEYALEGYVYKSNHGGYTIDTSCPSNLNVIAKFVGDFTHSGKDTSFIVQTDWTDFENYHNEEKICLKIKGVINAYVNDLSLYSDKEVYYYIVDGADAAYLVCEIVQYDIFSAGSGTFRYKTGADSGTNVTESIIIINMSNYTKHTFTVEYNTKRLNSSYKEKIEEFMGDSTTNNLFYVGYSNECQFSNYDDTVAYIKNALSRYGLADRVLSDSSSLSNYTPVFTTQVIAEPKNGSLDSYEDSQVRGKGIVGFPAYTGTWFPNGIVQGPVKPSENDSADSDSPDRYLAFLNSRGYLSDWTSSDLSSFYTLESYSLIDIDQNGTDELIITSNSDFGFLAFLVYTIDEKTGEIVKLPAARSDLESHTLSCYGDPRYSPKYKALVFSETRPTAVDSGVEYFVVAGECLHSIGRVGADGFITEGKMTFYSTLSGSFEEISEADRDGYISELTWLDYHPLP